MARLSIGEVARQSGFPASTLRYYESVGLLPAPKRVGGQRRYDPEVLYLLHAIEIAKRAGFTVDELIAMAQSMRELLEEGLRCGCLGVEECVLFGRERETEPV